MKSSLIDGEAKTGGILEDSVGQTINKIVTEKRLQVLIRGGCIVRESGLVISELCLITFRVKQSFPLKVDAIFCYSPITRHCAINRSVFEGLALEWGTYALSEISFFIKDF
jgi:hypothetical protein